MVKKIDWFDFINSYIELKEDGFNKVMDSIKNKNLSFREIQRKTGLSHTNISEFLRFKKSMKCKNLLKLINFLGIDKKDFRKSIYCICSNPYKEFLYKLNFPIKINPLHIRMVSHIIGDGCLERHNARWYQKNKLGGKYIKNSISKLLGKCIKKGVKDSYGIPIILADLVCIALNIKRHEIKTYKFIDSVLKLPKEYRIQFLAALIVDEGYIRQSSITISNTNEDLLYGVKKVVESLGYHCSDIKLSCNYIGKKILIRGNKANVNHKLKVLCIHSDGLLRFSNDIKKMIKDYNDLYGLWHKQNELEKWSDKINPKWTTNLRESKIYFVPLIKSEIEKCPLKVSKFAKKHNLDYIRAYKLFFRLKQKHLIKKIGMGTFASLDYNGPLLESLADKIKKQLSNKLIKVSKLAKTINGDPKAVSTQLIIFVKRGIAFRVKRGYYLRI